ncbi:hypothetical protein [Streptomyces indicus]|uniref:Uncharacterized protein n=1 Tax=Streptomyces indicus TaxID=417292 RepID=A0A1G9H0V9_9ACTN|nr:hypothetical protein [Streptomyces indicus]SDL06484.1 hypothetical protein SAMN05421806_117132 [Streptomyces indicus]
MFDQISAIQQIGLAVLLVATVAWVVGLVRLLRRDRFEIAIWREAQRAGALPAHLDGIPRQSVPHPIERVDLTEEEHAAFAGLVRRLSDKR